LEKYNQEEFCGPDPGDRGYMISYNERNLRTYIDCFIHGDDTHLFLRDEIKIVSSRTCIHCGKSYQIGTPYEECNPETRDLCDDCIMGGVKL
jgi:hypothetical protein